MEEFHEQGKVKSIGVSNFLIKHLEPLLPLMKVKPVVNQIETHPLFIEEETIKYCEKNNIKIISYAPLATFDDKLLKSEIVLKLSEKYGKTPSQIVLRWNVDRGFIPIPKSCKKEHIEENIQFGDFVLTEDEIKLLNGLNIGFKTDWDPNDEI